MASAIPNAIGTTSTTRAPRASSTDVRPREMRAPDESHDAKPAACSISPSGVFGFAAIASVSRDFPRSVGNRLVRATLTRLRSAAPRLAVVPVGDPVLQEREPADER